MRLLLFIALSTTLLAKPPAIEEGRKHWAFQPLSDAKPPAVINTAWPKNDIDRFILAKLEANGLQPAPAADPATLIRRITLDLTGLLPTPEEVEALVNECRQGSSFVIRNSSLEALADRLLQSPHYGERWGRHWLDAVGYVDAKVDIDIHLGYPVTVNSGDFTDFSMGVARDVIGADHVVRLPNPVMGAEDFSYVIEEVPGTMMFIGGTPLDRDLASAAPNHSNRVYFDERAMVDGAAIYTAVAMRHLGLA
jgi:hypothetical protein